MTDLTWFDMLLLHFDMGKENEIGVAVYFKQAIPKKKYTMVMMPVEAVGAPGFFDDLKRRVEGQAEIPPPETLYCKVCGSSQTSFGRDWKGYRFCSFCGSHYGIKNGRIVYLIAENKY
jgi:hypothetical protein